MSLTLPIVVGKKYVRRDGKVITASVSNQGHDWIRVDDESGSELLTSSVRRDHGRVWTSDDEKSADLVSDYIEPVKGHPHSAHITKFAWDARETSTPWDRWQASNDEGKTWHPMDKTDGFNPDWMYREKPPITPDLHADSMKLYAEDAAETDKAWERWEQKDCAKCDWRPLIAHPLWHAGSQYRRKASA